MGAGTSCSSIKLHFSYTFWATAVIKNVCFFFFSQNHHQSHPPQQSLVPPSIAMKPPSPNPPPSYVPPPSLDSSHPSLHHPLHPASVFEAVSAHYGQPGLHIPTPDLPAHLTGGQPERVSPPHLNQHALVSPPGKVHFFLAYDYNCLVLVYLTFLNGNLTSLVSNDCVSVIRCSVTLIIFLFYSQLCTMPCPSNPLALQIVQLPFPRNLSDHRRLHLLLHKRITNPPLIPTITIHSPLMYF